MDSALQLDRIASASQTECAALMAALAARLAALAADEKVLPTESAAVASRWVTPEQAATIAALPMSTTEEIKRSVRRIYAWTKGAKWAGGTRRCLRIDEAGFRRFLAARR
jgi:hypothetical protein